MDGKESGRVSVRRRFTTDEQIRDLEGGGWREIGGKKATAAASVGE